MGSIWRWWESRNHIFNCITKAKKLVALIRTSSTFAEQVFSQVKFVTNKVIEDTLRDNIDSILTRRVDIDLME